MTGHRPNPALLRLLMTVNPVTLDLHNRSDGAVPILHLDGTPLTPDQVDLAETAIKADFLLVSAGFAAFAAATTRLKELLTEYKPTPDTSIDEVRDRMPRDVVAEFDQILARVGPEILES